VKGELGDPVPGHVRDFEDCAFHLDGVAHDWDSSQSGNDEPGHRLVVAVLERDAGLLGEVLQAQSGVDAGWVAISAAGLLRVVLVANVPDELPRPGPPA